MNNNEIKNNINNMVNENNKNVTKYINALTKDTYYFRDIPCNGDLYAIYYIAKRMNLLENNSDLLGALLLKWFLQKKINIITKKGNLFKKSTNIITFSNNVTFDNNIDKEVYELLFNISNNGILDQKEFHKWALSHQNELNKLFMNIDEYQTNIFLSSGVFVVKDTGNLNNNYNQSTQNGFTSLKKTSYVISPIWHEYTKQVIGFKNFIKDFTALASNEANKVLLYEEYLIVAYLLGIAEYISYQFENVIPILDFKYYKIEHKKTIKVKGNPTPEDLINLFNNNTF